MFTKKLVKFLYSAYHLLFPSKIRTCRFEPTCSEYALNAVGKFGIFKGSWLALRRILSCQPFTKRPIYDPV